MFSDVPYSVLGTSGGVSMMLNRLSPLPGDNSKAPEGLSSLGRFFVGAPCFGFAASDFAACWLSKTGINLFGSGDLNTGE